MSFLVRQIALKSSGEEIVRPSTIESAELTIGRDAANGIIKSALVNGGETNKWAGTAEVLVVPLLA